MRAIENGAEVQIRVHGFVMLHGVKPGRYRVRDLGDGTCVFYRPRGHKRLVRHDTGGVNLWIRERKDANRIEIVG